MNIAQLQSRVSNLTEDVSNLNQINQEQEQALTAQSDMMNEGYIKIGTKKELQSIGLLSKGGLFSKKKLNISNLDPNVFEKIDIREFHTLTINGKSPKILTQIPETSYQITKNSDGTSTLTISDPTLFWSVSNFLIIQCK